MNLVVDASVACKWFFEEDLVPEAHALAESGADFVAPELILAECANAAWRRVQNNIVPSAHARNFLQSLPQWFQMLTPSVKLHKTAFDIACILGHPVYDCFYLALAQEYRIQFVTADRTLVKKARGSQWQDRITYLSDFSEARDE